MSIRLTNRARLTISLLATACAAALGLGGCASSIEPTVSLEASQYVPAFQAAREVLRAERYEIDRVDARAGVMSTQPNPTVLRGLDDFADRLRRVVRVEFVPATGHSLDPTRQDLTETGVPVIMHVRVTVQRVYYPGWRPSTCSVRLGGRHLDDDLVARDMQPTYEVGVREDEPLAGELAAKIMAKLAVPSK